MFELITMMLLSTCYIKASIDEAIEEKKQKEKERIRDLKISVFCYAIRHRLGYQEVVRKLQENKLTFEEIEKDSKEYENSKRN